MQKDKLRSLLKLPQASLSASFSITSREGFEIEQEESGADTEKAEAAQRILKAGKPEGLLSQARYYLARGLDYKIIDAPEKATASFIQAKQSCLLGTKNQSPAMKARFKAVLSEVLEAEDRPAEALKAAAEAAQIAPDAWEPQSQLGILHLNQVSQLAHLPKGNLADFSHWIAQPLTEKQLTEMESVLAQLASASKNSVTLAEKQQPNPEKRDPTVYYRRAGSITAETLLRSAIKAQRQATLDGKPFAGLPNDAYLAAMTSSDMQKNARSAVQCQGASPYGYGFIVTCEMVTRREKPSPKIQQWTHTQLRAIYDDVRKESQERLAAAKTAGLIATMSGDSPRAQALFAKALALSPKDDISIKGYIASLLNQTPAKFGEASSFLTNLLRSQDTSTYRLLLAKALVGAEDLSRAESVLEAAQKADPKNTTIGIALAVVRLKHTGPITTTNELYNIGTFLQQYAGKDANVGSASLWTTSMETSIVFYGLYDQAEKGKNLCKSLLQYEPDNELAKTFLSFIP